MTSLAVQEVVQEYIDIHGQKPTKEQLLAYVRRMAEVNRNKQLAAKTSMVIAYGAYAFEMFPYYNIHCAGAITATGRASIKAALHYSTLVLDKARKSLPNTLNVEKPGQLPNDIVEAIDHWTKRLISESQ